MKNKPVKKIVIAGGGTAGWITASVLAKAFDKSIDIRLIESDDIPTVGVGEATIPPLQLLHRILDINEREFVATVQGTFKLGIQFENWSRIGEKYIHSFGAAGRNDFACQFIQYWRAGLERGVKFEYGDYCSEHLGARRNKFATGASQSGLNYAYHFDAGYYAKMLRAYSEQRGVVRVEGKIAKVNTCADNGFIESLLLDSGELIEADFFVDCTGFRALLIGQTLNTDFDDWTHWLPCDRALAVQTKSIGPAIPYTRSIAHPSGWQWRIPLQHRVGNGLVYCSQFISDEEAKETLLTNLEGETLTMPKLLQFKTGTRAKHWNKNCVAIGLSSGFLEPLESTSIHLIQQAALRFAKLFPVSGVSDVEVEEFNSQMRVEVERVRDFIILHYKVTERDDSPFWNYCRTMSVPDSLTHRIELFKQSGRVFKAEADLFWEESWIQVMLGQGLMPESYHPSVDSLSDEELAKFLDQMYQQTKQFVDKLPMHADFINFYCKSVDM